MPDFRVDIEDSLLRRLINDTPQNAGRFVTALATEGQAYAMESFGKDGSPAPAGSPPGIDTGTLKNSITVENIGGYTRRIVAGTDYAMPLEFGHHGHGPWPFMLPMSIWLNGQVERLADEWLLGGIQF